VREKLRGVGGDALDAFKGMYGERAKDDLVLNDWGGINHKSCGYLRTPELSGLLAEFIKA